MATMEDQFPDGGINSISWIPFTYVTNFLYFNTHLSTYFHYAFFREFNFHYPLHQSSSPLDTANLTTTVYQNSDFTTVADA
jgi:hypothetical protein